MDSPFRLIVHFWGIDKNSQIRRRFKVIGSFVNDASCLRLASAVLMEVSDSWESGKVYLNLLELLSGSGATSGSSKMLHYHHVKHQQEEKPLNLCPINVCL